MSICATLSEGGFSVAVIQRKNLTDDDCSTVFWFNLAATLPVIAIIWFGAPMMAAFYNEPQLVPMFRVMTVGFLLSAPSTVQYSRLERGMEFRKIMGIQFPSFVIAAAVGITMAMRGYGAWSLIGMGLAKSMSSTLAIWMASDWRPSMVFRRQSFHEMFGYGVKTAMERVSNTIFENLITIVVGRVFNATEVGYYNRAKQYQQLPAHSIYSILIRVLLPMLSSVQGQKERMRAAFSQSLRVATMASFPVLAGMLAVAEPMVLLLIGTKWLPCVPYLQILCLSAMLLPLHAINVNAILSQGHSGLSLKLNLTKQMIQVVAIAATYRHGVIAMLWSQVATSIIAVFINAWPNRTLMGFPMRSQWLIIAPYAALSAVMALGVIWALPYFSPIPAWQLLGGCITGILIYAAGLKLMRFSSHREIANLAGDIPYAGKLIRAILS